MIHTSLMSDEQFLDFLSTHPVGGGDDGDDSAPDPSVVVPPQPANPNLVPPPTTGALSGPPVQVGGFPDVTPGGAPLPPPPAPGTAQGQAASPQAAQAANNPAPTTGPPPTAGVQSVWKTIAMGAMYGLAGGGGARTFGAGASGGAKMVLSQQQQALENAQIGQKLQFESLKSAADMADAKNAVRAADDAHLEAAQRLAEHDLISSQNMLALGIQPKTISADNPKDFHAQATGMLTTLGQQNGGPIGSVAVTNSPDKASDDGKTHITNVYVSTPQSVAANPNNARKIVDQAEMIKTGSGMPDAMWNSGKGKMLGNIPNPRGGQAEMQQDAIKFLLMPPPVEQSDKDGDSKNAATSANMHQMLDAFQKNSNADPAFVKQFKSTVDTFDSSVKDFRDRTNAEQADNIRATAGAKADAAQQEDLAKQNTPQGRAELAKTIQGTLDAKYGNVDKQTAIVWKNGVDPVSGTKLTVNNAPDEMLMDTKTGQPIPTAMLSTLKPSATEIQRGDFATSAIHILDTLDAARKAGNVPNGPVKGWTAQQMAKAGLGDAKSQAALNDIALEGSAATAAHTGRFSAEIMHKMNSMINLNMQDSQMDGAISSIRGVMQGYQKNGYRETVGEYKQANAQYATAPGKPRQVTYDGGKTWQPTTP